MLWRIWLWLEAEMDAMQIGIMDSQCPTPCDADCDFDCHSWHDVSWKREHLADSCQTYAV